MWRAHCRQRHISYEENQATPLAREIAVKKNLALSSDEEAKEILACLTEMQKLSDQIENTQLKNHLEQFQHSICASPFVEENAKNKLKKIRTDMETITQPSMKDLFNLLLACLKGSILGAIIGTFMTFNIIGTIVGAAAGGTGKFVLFRNAVKKLPEKHKTIPSLPPNCSLGG